MKQLDILCVGGDARTIYMCEKLAENARVYALLTTASPRGAVVLRSVGEMTVKADVLVLPMLMNVSHTDKGHFLLCGLNRLSLEDLIPLLRENAIVAGGLPDKETAALFAKHGYELTDYFKRRELIVKNCIPTAEGALMIAMQELAVTVNGCRVLVTGFGNVAKAAAKLFSAVGAEVTCAVRRNEAAEEVRRAGYESIMTGELKGKLGMYDIIINTVPALLLTEPLLEEVIPKAVVIDLASKPGGVDFKAAEKLGVRCIHALALPGKVAPVTAGRYIAETVENIISERGV